MKIGSNLTFKDPNGVAGQENNQRLVSYVGIPMVAKINYIEQPQASFSWKLGIMPAMVAGSREFAASSAGGVPLQDTVGNFDVMALTGFTATNPLGLGAVFVVDATYYRGTISLDGRGSYSEAIFVGLGRRFDL